MLDSILGKIPTFPPLATITLFFIVGLFLLRDDFNIDGVPVTDYVGLIFILIAFIFAFFYFVIFVTREKYEKQIKQLERINNRLEKENKSFGGRIENFSKLQKLEGNLGRTAAEKNKDYFSEKGQSTSEN